MGSCRQAPFRCWSKLRLAGGDDFGGNPYGNPHAATDARADDIPDFNPYGNADAATNGGPFGYPDFNPYGNADAATDGGPFGYPDFNPYGTPYAATNGGPFGYPDFNPYGNPDECSVTTAKLQPRSYALTDELDLR